MTSSCKRLLVTMLIAGLVLGLLTAANHLLQGSGLWRQSRLTGDVLLTFDLSGSMDGILGRYREALQLFVRSGAWSASRLGLRTFGGFGTRLEVPVSRRGFYRTNRWLTQVQGAFGGTPMASALSAAAEDFRASKSPNKAVLLVSDGVPTDGEEAACAAARGLKKSGISIHYVHIGDANQNLDFLDRLIHECGTGELIVVAPEDLAAFMGRTLGSFLMYGVLLTALGLILYSTYFQARFLSFLLPRYVGWDWLEFVPSLCLLLWFLSSLGLLVLLLRGLAVPWLGKLVILALIGIGILATVSFVRTGLRRRMV